MPSPTSGTSSLNSAIRSSGAVRLTKSWGPLASARTSTEWRDVELPFARFRTINPRTDGRLDPAAAQAVVFVLDHAAVKPGTAGTLWISDLGVYRD